MRTWESPPTRFRLVVPVTVCQSPLSHEISEYNTYDGGCLEMKREELGHKANMATSKKPIMLSNQSYGRSKTQNLNGWKIAPFSSCWQLLKVVLILVMIQTQLGHARASPISLSDLHGVEPVPAPWPTRATTYALLFLLFRATSFPNREIVIRRQRLRLASFVWFLAGLCSFVRNDVHGGGKELEWLTILLWVLSFMVSPDMTSL